MSNVATVIHSIASMDDSNSTFLCNGHNVSGESLSDVWLVKDRVSGQVTAAFILLILVVGLPWNLLVVITIVKEKLYHQPTIALLLNLALNDAIMLIFMLPIEVATGFIGEFPLGNSDVMRCQYSVLLEF